MYTKYLRQKCRKKKGVEHNHVILRVTDNKHPSLWLETFAHFKLSFLLFFFSFLLLMGLIIFFKKIDDSGKGGSLSSWSPVMEWAGLSWESDLWSQVFKQEAGLPGIASHPLLFIRVRAADCQLINQTLLGPQGHQVDLGALKRSQVCVPAAESALTRPKTQISGERRMRAGVWKTQQPRSSQSPWAGEVSKPPIWRSLICKLLAWQHPRAGCGVHEEWPQSLAEQTSKSCSVRDCPWLSITWPAS